MFYTMIYKYDPEDYTHHNKVMYCMVKGNHIYTLNHGLKALQQKYKEEDFIVIKANPNYQINENRKVNEYIMIQSIDDILNIKIKTSDEIDTKCITHLICNDDALTEIWYELIHASYEPSIKYQASCSTHINLQSNKLMCMISTQQLVPGSLDGSCSVSCEIV